MKKADIEKLIAKANDEREYGNLDHAVSDYLYLLEHVDPADIHSRIHGLLGLAKCYKLQYQESKLAKPRQEMARNVAKAEHYLDVASAQDKLIIFENVAEVAAIDGDWEKVRYWWSHVLEDEHISDAYAGRAHEHRAEALCHLEKPDEALADARRAIMLLEKSRETERKNAEYMWQVWYSGALMKLYYILKKQNNPEAEEVEVKVEEAIKPELLARRRRQWKDLKVDNGW